MSGIQKEFLIRVAADIRAAQQTLSALTHEFEQLGVSGTGAAQNGLDKTTKEADRANASMADLTGTVIQFAVAIGALRQLRAFVDLQLQFQAMQATLVAATGDAVAANAEYAFLVQTANQLGLSISSLARPYAQLLAASKETALEGAVTRDIFRSLAEAMTVLKLTGPESERAVRAIQQIMSKGTVSAEELRLQLGDVLPGAMQIAARAMGVTTEEFQKMLANGEVLSNDFLPRFAQEMSRTFAPGLTQSVSSLAAEINRLKNNLFEMFTQTGAENVMTDLVNGVNTAIDAIRELIRTGDLLNNKTIKELAQDYRSSREGGAQPVTSFLLEGVNTPPPAGVPSGPTAEELERASAAAEKLNESLQIQAAVLRVGEFAAIDYRRVHGDLTNATKEQMETIYESIRALVSVREEIERKKKVEQENASIMRERNKLMDEGTRITEQLRTPLEAFNAELAKQNLLWQEGAINTQTYERAVARAQKTMEEATRKLQAMDKDALQFARSMESAFSSSLFDVMDGRMENMAENWSRTLKRMLAELLASQLFQYMRGAGGGTAGTSGGGAGGTSGGGGGGGSPTATARARSTGLTRDTGIASTGSEGGSFGGDVTVLIENKGTPTQATEGRAQIDARGLVVSVMLDDLRRGGPIAGNLENTYRLKRKQ